MALNGIDISNWQSGINLAVVPCDFVVIKATEGTGYVNPVSFAGLAGRVCGCGKLYRYTGKGKLQTAVGTGIMREGKTRVFAEASAENYSGKSGFAGEAECEYAWEAAQNAARRDEGKRADLRRDSL